MRTRTRLIILAVSLLALVAIGIYLYLHRGSVLADDGIAYAPGTPMRDVPAGYSEYRTQQYHYSILYPKDMNATQYGGGGDSFTVAFTGGKGGEEFQVFATPYNEPQVTAARFKLDNPSGVIDQPQDVVIAGTPARIFFSKDARLGDTREVWFIHQGILYEVTAQKDLDEWLGTIMQSWQFVE